MPTPTFPITVTTSLGSYNMESGNSVGTGPFAVSALVRYLIYQGSNTTQGIVTLGAIKSSDEGVDWDVVDEAGAPAYTATTNTSYSACYDGARYIWVTYMQVDFSLHVVAFDTQTDTWGSPASGPSGVVGTSASVSNVWVSAISKVAMLWQNSNSDCKFQLFNPVGSVFETQTSVGKFGSLNGPLPWGNMSEDVGGVVHYTTMQFQGINSGLIFQSVQASTLTFSSVQQIATVLGGDVGINSSMVYDPTTGLLTLAWNSSQDSDPTIEATINVIQGISELDVSFSALTSLLSPNGALGYSNMFMGITGTSQLALFWADGSNIFYYSLAFAAPTILGTASIEGNLRSIGFSSATTITGYALAWGRVGYWELDTSPPPPPTPTVVTIPQAGNWRIPVTPNLFTECLVREYRLFKNLDYTKIQCGGKPDCFCVDERDWGGSWGDDDEVPVGPPAGAIAFNPVGIIPLPAVTDGEVVIFSEPCPIGYDGVITGQFNQYIHDPSADPSNMHNFFEGSGDIAWRVASNNRYLRDCGQILCTLGTSQGLSPVAGGLQVRSGDVIQYRVQVYNLSGLLVAGLGSIIAGLHGYWFPRRA